MAPFDPYHQWLGISETARPVSKYRLLSIDEFESDRDVISTAAERQTVFLRTLQSGEHTVLVAELLNEVSQARVTLVSADQKAEYDEELRKQQAPELESEPAREQDPRAVAAEQLAAISSRPATRPRSRGGKPFWQQPWATAAGGAIAMLLIMMLFGSGEDPQEPVKTNDKQTEQPSDTPNEQQAAEKVSPLQAAAQAAQDKSAAEKTIAETTLTFKGHKDQINSVAFSPNGNLIASGSSDNTVKVWNSKTGQEAITLQGHTHLIYSMRFSPDGRRIISASGDNTVKVWDAETGEEIHTLKGHTSDVASATYSPSGRQIASGGYDKTVRLWDAETGKIIGTFKGHSQPVRSVAFSPDSKWLVSGGYDKTVKLWNSETGQIIRTLKGHTNNIHSVVFSPDGTRIASGGDDNTLKVWNSNTGQEVLTLRGHSTHVVAVAFSPDGKWLASGSLRPESVGKVWDAETGQEMLTLKGHTSHVRSVAFSSDGKRIVSGSHDNTVKIWDLGSVADSPHPITKSLPPNLEQGLVAYYPFNGNAQDESGNGNHGEVHGATLTSDQVSRKNTAYEFDGVSDYISIIHSKTLDFGSTEPFSFSLWVKPTRFQNGNAIISKWQSEKSNGYFLRLIDDAGGIESGEGRAPGSKGIVAEKALMLSDWQQIGIVHRNGNTDLYRNGLLLARGPSIFSKNEDYITIGRDLTVTGLKERFRLFSGAIDDIRIYNRALSAAEVKSLYDYESKPSASPIPTAPEIESITNTFGMTLNKIPAGTFTMGSPEGEEGRSDHETQHPVTISKAFYMQTTEVTQGQWKEVMDTEPWKGKSLVKEGPNYPASYVSWDDAVAYCKKLSEAEGKTYRLPTEAEWEYACRAETTTEWSFGDDEKELGDYAWHRENAWDIDEKYAHHVGLKKSNAFGLYDMHGNVWEWCHDYYGKDYYKQSSEKDPTGPTSGSFRVLRGGSWVCITAISYSRSADRFWIVADRRLHDFGFRLVRELD